MTTEKPMSTWGKIWEGVKVTLCGTAILGGFFFLWMIGSNPTPAVRPTEVPVKGQDMKILQFIPDKETPKVVLTNGDTLMIVRMDGKVDAQINLKRIP